MESYHERVSAMFGLSRLLELAGTITWRLNDTAGRRWLGSRRQPLRRASPGVENLEGRIVPTLLGQQIFPSDYPWNQNISNAPVAANSAAIIAHIGTSINIHPDWGDDSPANGSSPLYGIPFNVVHGNSTTKVNVTIDDYPTESDIVPVPIPAGAVIEGDYQNGPNPNGPGYGANQRGDSHLLIWDEDNNIAYELYGVARPSDPVTFDGLPTGGQWHAAQETIWDMKTDNFRTLGYTSADAAGLSILAGLARPDEGLPAAQGGQGLITHALRFTLPSGDVNPQYIYPASHVVNVAAGSTNLPFGARLRLMNTPAVNSLISTLGPEAQIIARAMQQYGLVLADLGSAMFVSGASASVDATNKINVTWDMNDISGLRALNAGEFEVVNLTPVVTGLSVSSGSAGSSITISGQNFSGAAGHLSVLFGSTAATSVTVVSDSQVSAVIPNGSGTVDMRVQSGVNATDPMNVNNPIFGYGISAVSSADQFTYGSTSGSASSLTLGASLTTSTAGAGFTITVTAKDASGNTATSYAGTVHFTSSDAQAALPANYTFTAADAGVHTFNITLKTAGSDTITVSDTTSSLLTATAAVTVSPAAASRLSVSGFPTSVTAGTSATVTVTAQDPYGNVSKSYTGTVHFTSGDSQAALPADYTFVSADNGVHSFSVTLKTAGTESITATDTAASTIKGSQSGITVAAAAASKLAVSGFPTSATAGTSGTVTVTAQDAYGNVAKGYTGTVHFTSSDSQAVLPVDYTFVGGDNGVHSFSVTLKTAGTESITATDKTTSTIIGTESGISVAAAAASNLVVSGFPTSVTAGVSGNVTVTTQDAYGNVVTGYTGTVHFTSSDSQAGLPADYTFVGGDNGVHSFSITLKTAGTDSITATDTATSTIKGSQSGIAVAAAAASKLTVSGFPTSATAGTLGTVTVSAQDAYGNVAKGYTGTVHFTSSDSQAVLPGDYTFVGGDNGVHSFSVTLKTTGTQSITATDKTTSTITGTESGISVAAAAASKLVVSGFPTSVTAGASGTMTVTAQDANGNVVTGYTGTVHFTSSDFQAVLPGDYTFVGGDNGVHSFSVTLRTAGTESVTAADKTTSTITGTESGISVAAAAASKFVVSGFPTSVTAGASGTVTATAQDAYGNVAKGYTGTVHFTSSDSQAALPGDYTFVGGDSGVHSFSVTLKTAGTESISATDKTTSTITGTESGISVAAAAASKLVVSGFPTLIMAGNPGTGMVMAVDAYGNVATGYAGTVQFTSTDTQASLPANYTFVSADKGSHSFSVTLKTAGSQSVTATDQNNASLTGTESGIVVTPAAAQLAVSGFPTSITAGTAGTVTVAAKDAFGNLAAGYVGTVQFTSTDTKANLPANYTFVSSDKGSHSFSVTLKTAGSQSVTATDQANASLKGTDSGITVNAGSASQLAFAAAPAIAVAGTTISPAVQMQVLDQFGNLLLGDNSDRVTLAVASGPASFTSGSVTSVTVSGGIANFSSLVIPYGGAYGIGGSTGGLTSVTAIVHVARTGPPPSWLTNVANGLTHSAEYFTLIVTAAYQRYLGRTPDSIGLAGWVSQMQQGLTDEHLEAGFIGSTEYIQNHGGLGSGWITAMYQNLLGRTPSQADINSWLQALANGVSTTAIAYGFAASAEREGQRVTADYQQYLGRAPSAAEVTGWVNAFLSGAQTNEGVVAGFVGSTEYFKKNFGNGSDWFAAAYQAILSRPAIQAGAAPSFLPVVANTLTQSAEYYTGIVIAAYLRYLGRTPGSTELAGWVSQMQQGLTDEHLEAGFIGSTEYIQNHGGPGSGWITAMYKDLLGRVPSQADINSWLQALANGVSTTSIAYGFAASAEREGQRVTADYQQYLGRTPTAAEVASWVNNFESGAVTNENVVAGFIGSLEYFQKYNSDSQHWWNQAVQALFGASGF